MDEVERLCDEVMMMKNGEIIDKTRSSIEPQIYPTANIIGDLSITSGQGTGVNDGIFVDDATAFLYEKERYSQSGDGKVDALISSGAINVAAAVTATVSAAGTISSLSITNPGRGYVGSAFTISISPPVKFQQICQVASICTFICVSG